MGSVENRLRYSWVKVTVGLGHSDSSSLLLSVSPGHLGYRSIWVQVIVGPFHHGPGSRWVQLTVDFRGTRSSWVSVILGQGLRGYRLPWVRSYFAQIIMCSTDHCSRSPTVCLIDHWSSSPCVQLTFGQVHCGSKSPLVEFTLSRALLSRSHHEPNSLYLFSFSYGDFFFFLRVLFKLLGTELI